MSADHITVVRKPSLDLRVGEVYWADGAFREVGAVRGNRTTVTITDTLGTERRYLSQYPHLVLAGSVIA